MPWCGAKLGWRVVVPRRDIAQPHFAEVVVQAVGSIDHRLRLSAPGVELLLSNADGTASFNRR
jgi:hypothetical protein